MIYNTFCKMFVIFYVANLCICVFITCATAYCFYNTFGSIQYISVCVCVWGGEGTCTCRVVHVYAYMESRN